MDAQKKTAIQTLVDASITSFAEGLISRYEKEKCCDTGVINMKKNNCFIAELGDEFMFYSAFVRSFDSSLGNILERLGNNIAKLSFEVRKDIHSFLLTDQVSRISSILDNYLNRNSMPAVEHYANFEVIYPQNVVSFERSHVTDNYFYNPSTNEHYLIELKASGDLDNKKARSEKNALLEEYFLLKNLLKDDNTAKIKIYFGTAYNKFGEGNYWKQERVRQFFCNEELLIGKDYWNFVCNDDNGFNVIFEQYKNSAESIKQALIEIKEMYFNND